MSNYRKPYPHRFDEDDAEECGIKDCTETPTEYIFITLSGQCCGRRFCPKHAGQESQDEYAYKIGL